MNKLLDFFELQHALANQKPFTEINTDDPSTWGEFKEPKEEDNDPQF